MSSPPPVMAPYQPPPTTPPPVAAHAIVTDSKAVSALLFGILGLLFALPLGLPGLIAGPIAYFLGKGARQRISESSGSLSGAGPANAGRILGIAATAVGAVVTLLYLILFFNALLDAGSQGGF